MRFVMINLFLVCMFLFGIGYLAFSDTGTDADSQGHDENNAAWDAHLETCYELFKTDPEAARVELDRVAKELFNEHPLTEEWIEHFYQVFYRIGLNETGQDKIENPWEIIPDLIRVYELGLEMLTAVDPEKYAKEIQHHRDALEYYTGFAEQVEAAGAKPLVADKTTSDAQENTSQSEAELSDAEKEAQILTQHMEKFYELLATDPDAARKELETGAAIAYQGHPLAKEWVELFFRMGSEGGATVSDIIRFTEMMRQMRTDMDPEKYADEIKEITDNLEQLKLVAKMYELDGKSDTKIPFSMKSADKKSEKKDASNAPNISHSEKIGKPAMDFQAVDLKGQELSLKKFRGQVVLLDFWATWCVPCKAEMPHLKKVYDKYKDQKFEIIGISLDHGQAVLDSYIEKQDITWPQFLDNGTVAKMYNVTGIPATFLIDGDGIVRKVQLRGNALETAVAELVKKNLAK